jgi:hypothetical protein
MTFVTDRKDEIRVQLAAERNPAPVNGRPVVYLDQNQWSTISKAIHCPERVANPDELHAAYEIVRLRTSGRIILPLSAAHMNETSQWGHSEGRYELAFTILALSAGWQMRDPLEVRASEFRRVIAGYHGRTSPTRASVITLEPYAALDVSLRERKRARPVEGIPREWRHVYRNAMAVSVYSGLLMDRRPMARGSSDGWLERVSGFSEFLKAETGDRSQRRRMASVFMLSDASREIASACFESGISPDEMLSWIGHSWSADQLGASAIDLFRATMTDKILSGSPWEANDLTDLMYLCTAAGYADYVVGERRTIGLLGQSTRRLGSAVRLHKNLRSLIPDLVASSD